MEDFALPGEIKRWMEYIREDEPSVVYMVVGEEVGEGGYRHMQGYMEMKEKTSMRVMKRVLDSKIVHLEGRKGTQTQAIDYCKKDDKWDESGTKKKPGRELTLPSAEPIWMQAAQSIASPTSEISDSADGLSIEEALENMYRCESPPGIGLHELSYCGVCLELARADSYMREERLLSSLRIGDLSTGTMVRTSSASTT